MKDGGFCVEWPGFGHRESRAPSDNWDNGELSQEVRDAIHLYVGKLKLARKGQILFQLHRTPGVDTKEVEMRFVQVTAQPLAKSLGFEGSSVTK